MLCVLLGADTMQLPARLLLVWPTAGNCQPATGCACETCHFPVTDQQRLVSADQYHSSLLIFRYATRPLPHHQQTKAAEEQQKQQGQEAGAAASADAYWGTAGQYYDPYYSQYYSQWYGQPAAADIAAAANGQVQQVRQQQQQQQQQVQQQRSGAEHIHKLMPIPLYYVCITP